MSEHTLPDENKINNTMFITAPVSSRSGYGAHARDVVWSFMEQYSNEYQIYIIDVPWGSTPRDYFSNNDNKSEKEIKIFNSYWPLGKPVDFIPDVYVDIRIPNEFEVRGKVNIGVTAGVETNAVSQNWLEKCNAMNAVIVPSTHSADGIVSTVYDKMHNNPNGTQEKIGELKSMNDVNRGEIITLFEGADEDVYKPLNSKEIDSEFFDWLNDEVPERFAFLFVGLWGQGGFGEDRKDIGTMTKVFYESFANKKKQPALILKTSGASPSVMDFEEVTQKINHVKSLFPQDWKLPNVYLLHGNLSDTEMNYLYNHPKVKAMVSFTHGEGFGRPLLEATMVGLPVMVSGWSGQLDFLDKELSLLLPGELVAVPQSQHWENIIIPESQWFKVDSNAAYKGFNMLYDNYDTHKIKAKKLMEINRNKFTLNNMTKLLGSKLKHTLASLKDPYSKSGHSGLNDFNQAKINPVGLKLPKLKDVDGKVIEERYHAEEGS